MTPPLLTRDTDATPDVILQWLDAFAEDGGGSVADFAEYLATNARCGDDARRYEGRMELGL
jgi:hypothetical protein